MNSRFKKEERLWQEARVAFSFGADLKKPEHREYVECIVSRTLEAKSKLNQMENKRR